MRAEYRFVDQWFVPGASPEEVYDVLGDQLSYPRWWSDVFLEVEGDEGEPRPGRRARVKARGFLPYRLRYTAETVEADRPRRISVALSGDFGGGGDWTIESGEGGTHATLDWRPHVEKPVVKYLTPILRPLFRANHTWAMVRGQRHIIELFERRRDASSVLGASGEGAQPSEQAERA